MPYDFICCSLQRAVLWNKFQKIFARIKHIKHRPHCWNSKVIKLSSRFIQEWNNVSIPFQTSIILLLVQVLFCCSIVGKIFYTILVLYWSHHQYQYAQHEGQWCNNKIDSILQVVVLVQMKQDLLEGLAGLVDVYFQIFQQCFPLITHVNNELVFKWRTLYHAGTLSIITRTDWRDTSVTFLNVCEITNAYSSTW